MSCLNCNDGCPACAERIAELEKQVAGYELQINSMVISHREQQQQHDETRRLAQAVVDIHEMNSVHPCQAMDELKAHLDALKAGE